MSLIGLADVQRRGGADRGPRDRAPRPSRARSMSRATGADVVLKLDQLQVTGAFKERGAANRLALLSPRPSGAAGVVAMSAGNHASAVARHAQLLGISATIVMPVTTPLTKVTRTAGWGANVVLHGEMRGRRRGPRPRTGRPRDGLMAFIHPYDDPGGHGRPRHARAGAVGGFPRSRRCSWSRWAGAA